MTEPMLVPAQEFLPDARGGNVAGLDFLGHVAADCHIAGNGADIGRRAGALTLGRGGDIAGADVLVNIAADHDAALLLRVRRRYGQTQRQGAGNSDTRNVH